MKRLYTLILATVMIAVAGCQKDDPGDKTPEKYDKLITDQFDSAFARVLEERGYIADAEQIFLNEIRQITELDVSGRNVGFLTSLRGIELFESLTVLDCGALKTN